MRDGARASALIPFFEVIVKGLEDINDSDPEWLVRYYMYVCMCTCSVRVYGVCVNVWMLCALVRVKYKISR